MTLYYNEALGDLGWQPALSPSQLIEITTPEAVTLHESVSRFLLCRRSVTIPELHSQASLWKTSSFDISLGMKFAWKGGRSSRFELVNCQRRGNRFDPEENP